MMLSNFFQKTIQKTIFLFQPNPGLLWTMTTNRPAHKLCPTSIKTKPFRSRLHSNLVTGLIIISLLHVMPLSALASNRKLKYLSEAHFEFSIDLYHQVAKSKSGNIVISAQNVNLGLSMLFLGSTSNTTSSQELRRTLHYENMSYVDIHKSHRQVLQVLSEPYYGQQGFYSKVGLFVQKGAGVKPNYDRAVREFYQSQIIDVDFGASGSGQVVDAVNSWVTNVTDGNVTSLLETGPGSAARLLVASAAQLEPQWLFPFDPLKTSYNGLFFLPGGQRLTVPMMTAQLNVPVGYSQDLEARILELPLTARRMSMFLILPDHLDPGIHQMEANFTTHHIKALMATLQDEVVNVKLPRFRIEDTLDLGSEIQALGSKDIFSPGEADFSNMVKKNLINLSFFKHRAKIETKEWGRHGISEENEKKKIGVLKQKYFEVDRAFLYFVWDYFTGSIMFIGRVTRPIVL